MANKKADRTLGKKVSAKFSSPRSITLTFLCGEVELPCIWNVRQFATFPNHPDPVILEGTMKKVVLFSLSVLTPLFSQAGLINSIPGPSDQGGMVMPMISIVNADDYDNPTRGEISIGLPSAIIPVLRTLEEFSPGAWFAESAAWRENLGSPEGIGGTPPANAGNGNRFNNQYGFMFMANPMMDSANIPLGKSLGIRLHHFSSSDMRSFNYVKLEDKWDPIFEEPGSQVLWSGMMWHNYFTLPAGLPLGFYTATFEIFIADKEFTPGTGAADYSPTAQQVENDPNFASAFVELTFRVIEPEGITYAEWLAENWSEEELAQEENTSFKADPGGYGIPNLLRYAFVLDARNPDRREMPKAKLVSVAEGDDGPLALRFRQRVNALDLRYQVEESDDLQLWTTVTGESERHPISTGAEFQEVISQDSHSNANRNQSYLRVSVRVHEVP